MNNKKNEKLTTLESNTDNVFSLEYVKNYLRIDNEYDDEFLQEAIKTAITFAEKMINHDISNKKIQYSFIQTLNTKQIAVENKEINDVETLLIDGVEKQKDTNFTITNGKIEFNENISGNILIVFTTNITTIESDIKQAILFHIANIYQNKSGLCKVPDASMEIYNMNKQIRF